MPVKKIIKEKKPKCEVKNRLPKILLAEDDVFISRAYQDGLGRAGFNIIAAADGAEALKKAEAEVPDLILLDVIMPIKNGFEVLEELKKNEKLKNIPVIVLSNLGQDSDIEKGRKLGAADYLIKSNHSLREVAEKVSEHLSKIKK
jgi:DNA-binding response OmpR family regulator